MADYVGSTDGLLQYVGTSPAKAFIIGTEAGVLHQMHKLRPEAELIPIPVDSGCNCSLCPYMKLNTLEKLYLALRDLRPEIELDEAVRLKALGPVRRMLELG
jgi:quinolinate synthase